MTENEAFSFDENVNWPRLAKNQHKCKQKKYRKKRRAHKKTLIVFSKWKQWLLLGIQELATDLWRKKEENQQKNHAPYTKKMKFWKLGEQQPKNFRVSKKTTTNYWNILSHNTAVPLLNLIDSTRSSQVLPTSTSNQNWQEFWTW